MTDVLLAPDNIINGLPQYNHMLESFLNFKELSKNPSMAFIWSFIISSIAIFMSLQLSYEIRFSSGEVFNLTGLFAVIFTVIPLVYLVTYTLKKEEKMEEEEIRYHYTEKNLIEKHMHDMLFFLFLFFGITAAFAFWAFLLPESVFQVQLLKVTELQSSVSGNFVLTASEAVQEMITGNAVAGAEKAFFVILFNNLRVLVFAFIFSLLYGAGAIFIIVWNASILGVYIGYLADHILMIPVVTLSFLPHGLPEIMGYLFAGISGGILSASLIRKTNWDITRKIIADCLILLAIGALFIIVAAYIEAFL